MTDPTQDRIASVQDFIQSSLLHGKSVALDEDLLISGTLDSLNVMALVAHIETDHGIAVPPEDITLDNFETLNAIGTYLTKRAGGDSDV